MQQFTVPQFIDVEDVIMGPITTRQFVIFLADGLLLFIFYKLATFGLFVVLLAIFGGGGLVLAFVKINGQPFHFFILNFLQTMTRTPLRVWNKELTAKDLKFYLQVELPVEPPPKPTKEPLRISKLGELSLVVNTGGMYRPEE